MTAIDVAKVCKRYGALTAVDRVSFEIARGEVVGLLGRNGAGKTTLMKMLTGYLRPDEGAIALQGIDVVTEPVRAQAQLGYLPENAPVYHEMTVQEYLGMIADIRQLSGDRRRTCLRDAVLACGLEARLMQSIGKLSKGFRQRVGIAQAIVHKPSVLILDEPTAGLDPTQVLEIRALIADLTHSTTVLLSTHILAEVEANCRRVLVIERGELRANQTLAELTKQHAVIVDVAEAADLEALLRGLAGVTTVTKLGAASGGYQRWRLVATPATDLAAATYAALAKHQVAIRELRNDTKTLEHVFADLANTPVVAAADAPAQPATSPGASS